MSGITDKDSIITEFSHSRIQLLLDKRGLGKDLIVRFIMDLKNKYSTHVIALKNNLSFDIFPDI